MALNTGASGSGYVPNELLSRLVGDRLYSIAFVLNDYLQLYFDGPPSGGPVILNIDVWPEVDFGGRTWRESDLGYADALRKLAPGVVQSTSEATGFGLAIVLDTGAVRIHPRKEDVFSEIAYLSGFEDRSWMCWRPGEDSFEDLA